MNRLLYIGWILLAVALFLVALMFVLANGETVSMDLLLAGASWSAPLGAIVLAVFAVGAILGLLAGLGVRQLLHLRRSRE